MVDTGAVLGTRGGTVRLHGELDVAAGAALCATVGAAIAVRPRGGIVLDMSAVSFLDCAAIGALLELRDDADRAGISFTLLSVPAPIQRVLSILRLDGVFRVEDPSVRRGTTVRATAH